MEKVFFLKRNLPTGKYKTTFESPKTQQPCTQWVSVEGITSLTARKEKRKRAAARRHLTHSNQDKQKDTKKSDHRKTFRIVMTKTGALSTIPQSRLRSFFQPSR